MRRLVKSRAEPGLWLEDAEIPQASPNEVLIKIQKTSICGTDVHIYEWDEWAQQAIPVPMTIGHEFMGTVAAIGEEVDGFEQGQRVSGEGHLTCGHCRNCRAGRRNFCRNHRSVGVTRPGAFAEYLVLPAGNVFPVPDHISDDTAAVLDPLGNATHTSLAFDTVGEDVLITGAGPIGIMASAIVRHIGARFVVTTDVNPYRLELAAKMGVDRAVDPTEDDLTEVMTELGMTEGFDVALEMSGSPAAFADILSTINHGGSVAMLGIFSDEVTLDMNTAIFKGLTLRGIYGRRIFETWYKMAAMLQSGLDIGNVITHHFPAAKFDVAFEVMSSGQCGKVILDWE